jgi:hypothetical protein
MVGRVPVGSTFELKLEVLPMVVAAVETTLVVQARQMLTRATAAHADGRTRPQHIHTRSRSLQHVCALATASVSRWQEGDAACWIRVDAADRPSHTARVQLRRRVRSLHSAPVALLSSPADIRGSPVRCGLFGASAYVL